MVHPELTEISDEDLMQLSSNHPEARFERNADGSLLIKALTGGITGNRIAKACAYLFTWVDQKALGEVFGSSAGFRLANTAIRSPSVSFVARDRLPDDWDQHDDFLAIAPDFLIEICSKKDSLEDLKAKMQEYVENGVRLGWLIDRQNRRAFVYRADGSITQYPDSVTLSGEEVVPGFTLALSILL